MGNELRSGFALQPRDPDPEPRPHLPVELGGQRLGPSRWSLFGISIGFCALLGLLALAAYMSVTWHLEIIRQAHELERLEGVNDDLRAAAVTRDSDAPLAADETAKLKAALAAAAVAQRQTEVVVEALAAETSQLRSELESVQRGIDTFGATRSAGRTGRETLGELAAPRDQGPASPDGASADAAPPARIDQMARLQKQLDAAQADTRRLALVLLGEAEAINEATARARGAARAETEAEVQELTKERFELRAHVKRLTTGAQARADEVDRRQQQLDAAKAEIQLLTLALSAAQAAQQWVAPRLEAARTGIKAEVRELTEERFVPRASAEADAQRRDRQRGPKLGRTQP